MLLMSMLQNFVIIYKCAQFMSYLVVFHVDKLLCSSIREFKALDKLDPNDLFYSPLRIHHDNIILSADLCHSYKSGDQIDNDDRQ